MRGEKYFNNDVQGSSKQVLSSGSRNAMAATVYNQDNRRVVVILECTTRVAV